MFKLINYLLFIVILEILFINTAFSKDEILSVGGYLNSSFDFNYVQIGKDWKMDYPIHGSIYLNYKKSIMEARCGLLYNGSIRIGDLYIKGGNNKSYMKLGNFLEDWDISKSADVLMSFSKRDESYSNNIFYIKQLLSTPTFKIAFFNNNLSQELVLSQGEDATSINNHIVGFKSTVDNGNNSISLGVIRRIGVPPPDIFLQLKGSSEAINEWLEISWIYNKNETDEWSALFGVEKHLDNSSGRLELLLSKNQDLFYINNSMLIKDNVLFNLSFYLSLNDWSSAWNTAFRFLVNQNFDMELGGTLFLGKNGKYFSPREEMKDNNDSLYLRLGFKV